MPRKSKEQTETGEFAGFEQNLNELEELVQRMEQGDQTLEQSLKDFERGVTLARNCEKTLQQAEQRVAQLVQQHGALKLEPFSPEE